MLAIAALDPELLQNALKISSLSSTLVEGVEEVSEQLGLRAQELWRTAHQRYATVQPRKIWGGIVSIQLS